MAKKFFPENWESISKEELSNSRARLSGFIESTTEKEKTIRDVSIDLGLIFLFLREKMKRKTHLWRHWNEKLLRNMNSKGFDLRSKNLSEFEH